ncbi:MAG: MarR family transcriptional regulator [Pseudomonadota bacterium]
MQIRRSEAHRKALFLRPDELDRSIALVLLAARGFEAAGAEDVPRGLAPVHRLVLLLLKSGMITTAADLKTLLGAPKQTVSRYVQQLDVAGLVEREDAVNDRRRKLLRLTARGQDVAERLDRGQRRRLAAVFKTHGPAAVADFEAVLLDLVEPRVRPFLDDEATT